MNGGNGMYDEFVHVMQDISEGKSQINIKRVDDIIRRSKELGIDKELFEDPLHAAWRMRLQDRSMSQAHQGKI